MELSGADLNGADLRVLVSGQKTNSSQTDWANFCNPARWHNPRIGIKLPAADKAQADYLDMRHGLAQVSGPICVRGNA